MARKPKPYLHQGWYCTSVGGAQHQKLCKEEEGLRQAEIQLARLVVLREDAKQGSPPSVAAHAASQPSNPAVPLVTVAQVFDAFLDFKMVEGRPSTYDWYRQRLTPFFAMFGARPVASLTEQDGLRYKKYLLEEKPWRRGNKSFKGLGHTTVNSNLVAARTLLTWASKPSRRARFGLHANPWAELTLVTGHKRERVLTDQEMASLLSMCKDGRVSGARQDFREFLTLLRHTTMRPGEARLLRWEYVQIENHRAVFPPAVIKTKSRREVTLVEEAEAVLRERRARALARGLEVKGYVFPRSEKHLGVLTALEAGERPRSADNVVMRFWRLVRRCVRAGLIEDEKGGERIVMYSTRHTRISELVREGHSLPVVMAEAGHKLPNTTMRYVHLTSDYINEEIRRRKPKDAG
jgi:integrase